MNDLNRMINLNYIPVFGAAITMGTLWGDR